MIDDTDAKELAKLFAFPCSYSMCEKVFREKAIEWCEKHCGKATADICWQKYFEIIRRNNNERKDT